MAHISAVIASDTMVTRWHFVTDNLDTHRSASLVRLVAEVSGVDVELGVKGKSGGFTRSGYGLYRALQPDHG